MPPVEPISTSKIVLALLGAVKLLVLYIWKTLTQRTKELENKVEDTYNKYETREQIELRLAPLRENIKELSHTVKENTKAQQESNEMLSRLVGEFKAQRGSN